MAIIVPNLDDLTALRTLLESIEENALYPYYKILIVDYGTEDLETLRYYDLLRANKAAQILHMERDNFAALWNYGAKLAQSPYLLFLRPSVQILTPGFLTQLMELCKQNGAGAVGCRCEDKDGAPLGEPMLSRDILENVPWLLSSVRVVSLLRGDALMVKSEVFFGTGCFDESMGSAGAAAEFCVRLMRRGKLNALSPSVRLCAKGEEKRLATKEKERLYDVLRSFAQGDPHLSGLWKSVWQQSDNSRQ